MANIKMKINLYKLNVLANSAPLAHLLGSIAHDPLDRRVRQIGYNQIRLEAVTPPVPGGEGFWYLDFVKMRMDHGPGRVGHGSAIQGFALAAEEGFGEQTAVLYDPATQYLLVQYNHHGVRGAAIERYLSSYGNAAIPASYELVLKLDSTSEARLAAKQFITKVHFKIAPAAMTAAHFANNVSLNRALALNDDQSGNAIELTISASRGQTLGLRNIRGLVDNLRSWVAVDRGHQTEVLSQFDVEAKARLTDRAEKIDMLLPALEQSIDGILTGPDRRYTLASRWLALQRARIGWRGVIGS